MSEASLTLGSTLPENIKFGWIPPTPEKEDIKACGIPITYNASQGTSLPPLATTFPLVPVTNMMTEWANKKVVVFSLPGAFTPTCSASHLPGYIANLPALRAKGVDIVATIAYNDPFVMSAWGKANGIHNEDILFLSDNDTAFSKLLGWTAGERTGRYALIIDHGKIVYAEKEPGREVTVSGAEAVLSKL
ncbi:hypothetical protein DSL72_006467 [Monilinia vaccinii-corymbosi]|uniref:Thioredoxin peroxidase n=1 Tax=Monilinia vaccinii-corymbosi TaxID=61207 RepID=A0A8A3PMA2_9HELO|nr:hypothetical protein DSL72_006467 [Monilinia vaccinii-corymbosi]